jgi:AraC-like DNA-binding protein
MDRLDALLTQFSVSAEMFHSGPVCGLTEFAAQPGIGQLHLLKRGVVEATHDGRVDRVDRPSLLLYPRALAHRFVTDKEHGADMACANLRFASDTRHPIAQGLPSVVILPLDQLSGAETVLELLFDEAFRPRCGGRQLVNRLFDVVLILILRALIDQGRIEQGLLAGLADPRLCHALMAIHQHWAQAWSLESLAATSGLSRTRFAQRFRDVVGTTPGDYLSHHRMRIAQSMLLQGRSLDQIALAVGYSGQSAFSRAFADIVGSSPRTWRSAQRG